MPSWHHDTMASWHHDTMKSWHHDIMTSWHHDTMTSWDKSIIFISRSIPLVVLHIPPYTSLYHCKYTWSHLDRWRWSEFRGSLWPQTHSELLCLGRENLLSLLSFPQMLDLPILQPVSCVLEKLEKERSTTRLLFSWFQANLNLPSFWAASQTHVEHFLTPPSSPNG